MRTELDSKAFQVYSIISDGDAMRQWKSDKMTLLVLARKSPIVSDPPHYQQLLPTNIVQVTEKFRRSISLLSFINNCA
jgi:hypothetical protein